MIYLWLQLRIYLLNFVSCDHGMHRFCYMFCLICLVCYFLLCILYWSYFVQKYTIRFLLNLLQMFYFIHVVPKHYVYLFFHMYFEVTFFGYNLTMENVYFIQACAISVDGDRPAFMTINGIIYLIQVKISLEN